MRSLYSTFSKSLRWSTIESLLYHAILLAHQLFLFNVTHYSIYGVIGIIFSSLYLLITITNFGLDLSISSLFLLFTKSKKAFKTLLMPQVIAQMVIYNLIAIVVYLSSSCVFPILPTTLPLKSYIDTPLLIILGLLFISEGIKKTARTMLNLNFLNKTTALIELATIITYTSCVWLYYMVQATITLYAVFVPMLIVSWVSTIILYAFLYKLYCTLPNAPMHIDSSIHIRIIKNRCFTYLNQLNALLFSSNMLTSLCALYGGLQQAALFKFISSITHCLTSISQKIFYMPSEALLSFVKEQNHKTKQIAFSTITYAVSQVIYGISIFFIINYKKLLISSTIENSIINVLFLIISLTEILFITYTTWYITQEKTKNLCIFNIINLCIFVWIIHYASYFSLLDMLSVIIGARVVSFLLISLFSLYKWKLYPHISPQPLYIACSLIISFTFFLITQ